MKKLIEELRKDRNLADKVTAIIVATFDEKDESILDSIDVDDLYRKKKEFVKWLKNPKTTFFKGHWKGSVGDYSYKKGKGQFNLDIGQGTEYKRSGRLRDSKGTKHYIRVDLWINKDYYPLYWATVRGAGFSIQEKIDKAKEKVTKFMKNTFGINIIDRDFRSSRGRL